MFSHRHITVAPLPPMPTLHFERAPLCAKEYRGVTPIAMLHRQRRCQLALLAHHEASIPVALVCEPHDGPPRVTSNARWSLASVALMALVVAAAVLFTGGIHL